MKNEHIHELEFINTDLSGLASLLYAVSHSMRHGDFNPVEYVDGLEMIARQLADITAKQESVVNDIIHNGGIEQ